MAIIKFTNEPIAPNAGLKGSVDQSFPTLFANELENQYRRIAPAFAGFSAKTHQLFSRLMISMTSLTDKATLSNAIRALGLDNEDHTKKYRCINNKHLNTRIISSTVLKDAIRVLSADSQFFLILDDVHTPKSGRKLPYAGYVHDPLADKQLSRTNLPIVWGHRYIHLSMLIPGVGEEAPRTITLALELVPKPESKKRKKKKKDMTPEEIQVEKEWHRLDAERSKQLGRMSRKKFLAAHAANCNLPKRALELVRWAINIIRQERPNANISVVGDGSYTCTTILQEGALPMGCSYIGAIRKDAIFQKIETSENGKATFGDNYKHTPQSLYDDDSVAFDTCENIVTGKKTIREFKEFDEYVYWEGGSIKSPLKVIAAKGLQYQNTKMAKARRREVVYLVSTSTSITAKEMCQVYHYRWGIETLHKTLKSVFGLGEAQVFGLNSVVNIASAFALANSMKELAFVKVGNTSSAHIEQKRSKWNRAKTNHISAAIIQSLLREGLFRNGFYLRSWNSAKVPGTNKGMVDLLMGFLQAG